MDKPTGACDNRQLYDMMIKLVIIGDSGVGKTNLLSRYTDHTFSQRHDITIGVEFSIKIASQNDKVFKIYVWDTAGQEVFNSITRNYYRGAVGCLIVYDITNRSSFNNIEKWVNDVKNYSQNDGIVMVLVGNKLDQQDARQVTTEEGQALAEKFKMRFVETSAKTGENVDHSFSNILEKICEDLDEGKTIINNVGKSLVITADQLNKPINPVSSSYCYC
jgi:small GTP-binding protein